MPASHYLVFYLYVCCNGFFYVRLKLEMPAYERKAIFLPLYVVIFVYRKEREFALTSYKIHVHLIILTITF